MKNKTIKKNFQLILLNSVSDFTINKLSSNAELLEKFISTVENLGIKDLTKKLNFINNAMVLSFKNNVKGIFLKEYLEAIILSIQKIDTRLLVNKLNFLSDHVLSMLNKFLLQQRTIERLLQENHLLLLENEFLKTKLKFKK